MLGSEYMIIAPAQLHAKRNKGNFLADDPGAEILLIRTFPLSRMASLRPPLQDSMLSVFGIQNLEHSAN